MYFLFTSIPIPRVHLWAQRSWHGLCAVVAGAGGIQILSGLANRVYKLQARDLPNFMTSTG